MSKKPATNDQTQLTDNGSQEGLSQMAAPNKQIPVQAQAARSVVTVIVPVYNDTDNLKLCLSALAESTYDRFDVLVVDDGSTEAIKPLVERFSYRYLRIDGPGGPARARNRGVEQVETEYVIFIDADVCVHPDTIS